MTEENHEETPVRLVGTGIRTRNLPNASLMRYHGATSVCTFVRGDLENNGKGASAPYR